MNFVKCFFYISTDGHIDFLYFFLKLKKNIFTEICHTFLNIFMYF